MLPTYLWHERDVCLALVGDAEFAARFTAATKLRNDCEEQRVCVVSAAKASSVVEALLELRVTGGSEKKRIDFADSALQLCETAQKWSTDGLRARASAEPQDEVESEDE